MVSAPVRHYRVHIRKRPFTVRRGANQVVGQVELVRLLRMHAHPSAIPRSSLPRFAVPVPAFDDVDTSHGERDAAFGKEGEE